MLILSLFSWWYSQGWIAVARSVGQRIVGVTHIFSVPILLRTLWAPWRRIVTVPGAGLDAKLRAIGDNIVSRCIGFTVRLLVLLAASVILLITALLGVMYILAWPIIPVAIPLLVMKGIFG